MRTPIAVTAALAWTSLACPPSAPVQTVPVPASDPTPPSLTLTVKPPNRQMLIVQPLSPAASSKVGSHDRIDMDAVAEDGHSGIRNVSIWYTTTRTSGGTTTGPGLLGSPQASAPNPPEPRNPGEQALVRRTTYTTLSMLNQPIGNNVTLVYDVWATAENYAGGKVQTSHVTLTWP